MTRSINVFLSYGTALLFALLLHGLVVGVLMVNWADAPLNLTEIKPFYIEASIVAENPFSEAKDKEKNQREKTLQRRRDDELTYRRQLEAWEKEDRKPKQQPKPEVEKAPPLAKEAEVRAPDKEQLRSEFEQSLTLAIVEEQGARKAVTDDEKAMAYAYQIKKEIVQRWSRPPSARNGMQSILRVILIPTGEVIDVKVEESSGNDAFDRSAVQAVRKAGRFVVPTDTLRFERDFREFTVLFRPEDLRL
jgi:colicin import membrane protein